MSTDEGELLWLNIEDQRVLHNVKMPDLVVDRVVPLPDDYALVKPLVGDSLL